VQDERVGLSAERRHDELDAVRHQSADEVHVARERPTLAA
jgi:hypothetical protein